MEKYHVRPIEINELNEEYYRMQKLAGLITEKQYNTHIQYKDYLENISKALDNLKQTLKDEGYDVK
jgi:biotin operon repressor